MSYSCNFCYDYGCSRCGHGNEENANVALKNFRLPEAVTPEVTDPKDLRKFFKNSDYIPYAGYTIDSQHSVLTFFDRLARQSPTLAGVIHSIGLKSFSGKSNIKKISHPQFDFTNQTDQVQTEEEISLNVKKAFAEHIDTFDLGGKDWTGLKTTMFKSLKANGNIFLKVEIVKSLGVSRVKFTVIPTKNCLYKNNTLFDRQVAISKKWDKQYLAHYPPEVIPVYPQYEKIGDNKEGFKSIKTVFHYKNGDGDYYGRPDWEGCIEPAFLEKKNFEYLLNACHNQFMGRLIIEGEEEPGGETLLNNEEAKKKGFKNAIQQWKFNFTNQGRDPQSILVLTRSPGSKELFVKELSINMNEAFYKTVDEMATTKIISTNAWSRTLANIESATGISNNSYIDDLKTHLDVIEGFQGIMDYSMVNRPIKFVNEMLEIDDFIELGLESKNPFDHLLKAAQETKLETPKPIQPVYVANK